MPKQVDAKRDSINSIKIIILINFKTEKFHAL